MYYILPAVMLAGNGVSMDASKILVDNDGLEEIDEFVVSISKKYAVKF